MQDLLVGRNYFQMRISGYWEGVRTLRIIDVELSFSFGSCPSNGIEELKIMRNAFLVLLMIFSWNLLGLIKTSPVEQ